MARKPPQLDIDLIRQAGSGRWVEVLSQLGCIPRDYLDGRHHPCPKCGGTDRFRLLDESTGAVICNQCFRERNGDAFAAVQWALDIRFRESAERIAEYLGVDAITHHTNGAANGTDRASHSSKQPPDKHLTFLPWSDTLAALWCLKKPPVKPHAIQAVGGRLARYRGDYTVIALPIYGPKLNQSLPVGWCLYNITGGRLPVFRGRNHETGKLQIDWKKVKLTAGSDSGVIGPVAEFSPDSFSSKTIWKVEGPSDLLALLSLELPADHTALCNACGAGERPFSWLPALTANCITNTLHDCDQPGQDGAATWADALAATASVSRIVRLPYPITETHGPDLRDWLRAGGSLEALFNLADQAAPVTAAGPQAIEAEDDPHRLARMNLARYHDLTGGTIKFWREEWYCWKENRYRKLPSKEFAAKVGWSIKEEFNRLSIQKQQNVHAGSDDGGTKSLTAKKVNQSLIANVMAATASTQVLSGRIELSTYLPDRSRRNWVGMKNGILDLDALLDDAEADQVLRPHGPDWFSTVCLPYAFDPDAECPQWLKFLERSMEGDQERIAILQEWAGYLLLPDTDQQKFMVLEGEGGNGKSVYLAGLEAMLGADNCSHVGLEKFGDRFSLAQTLGKLANLVGDMGEIDRVAEGHLKSFVAGDVMFFDRKNLPGVDCAPTARLTFSTNNRPRFSDKSGGIWRRMLLIPWRVRITAQERVIGMDKIPWWQASGELPGIFLWAIRGLHRLRMQKDFSCSSVSSSGQEDYRIETNPAREFLIENVEESQSGQIRSEKLYYFYRRWAEQNGYKPLANKQFFKEFNRHFPDAKRRKGGTREGRYWCYDGIQFSRDDIHGEPTNDTLF